MLGTSPRPAPRRTRLAVTTSVLLCAALSAPLWTAPGAEAASDLSVSWSKKSVVAGAKVTARVDRTARPDGTELTLERKFPGGWRVADKSATRKSKDLVLKVPTGQYGTFRFRVAARTKDKSRTLVTTSPTKSITVRTGYPTPGKAKQYLLSTKPRVRWDSCQTIEWAFYAKHSPRRALRQLKAGFTRMHRATGLDFRYVGRTDKKPRPEGHSTDAFDVVIGWRTRSDYQIFKDNRYVVGVGGSSYYLGFQAADGTKASRAFQGGVVLNASQKLRTGFGKGYTWGEVIVHELGHVVGLSHPAADKQIMYFQVTTRNADWGKGDLKGLRKVGNTGGCLTSTQRVAEREVRTFVAR